MKDLSYTWIFFIAMLLTNFSCKQRNTTPSKDLIYEINLKRGKVIACGPSDNQFGSVEFDLTCNEIVKDEFNLALKLLHSFEYDEAEKVFAKIIDVQPDCAMAYWGVAMSNFHPLWAPPSEPELRKGAIAIKIAKSIKQTSEREEDYIEAIASFYQNWEKVDHHSRCINFEKAMERLYLQYTTDKEAAVFYALALNAAADPTDKTFQKQKKAYSILNTLYKIEPNHPGIVHYIIHTYDYPELAGIALPAARRYASVAPSSAHALHMPSHIFTRLGLWDECIKSNLASVYSAQCYAAEAGIKGHWDEELHGMDYLVYAYLQKGENQLAKKQWDYLKTIREVYPVNFKVAYAYASIPSRFLLENKLWNEAAGLKPHDENFSWKNFQWQKAIIHFTRLMGSVHLGNLVSAKAELKELTLIHQKILEQKDIYKANQVLIQLKTGDAWIQFKEGKKEDAIVMMNFAADLEDKTEKHPVTPGEVIPARELSGDMYAQMNQPEKALIAYETDLKKHPNRFNGLYGAGLAAEKTGNLTKAIFYYNQLLSIVNPANSERPELNHVKQFLKAN